MRMENERSLFFVDPDIQRYDSQYAKEVLVEPMPPTNPNKAAEYSQLVTRKFKVPRKC